MLEHQTESVDHDMEAWGYRDELTTCSGIHLVFTLCVYIYIYTHIG